MHRAYQPAAKPTRRPFRWRALLPWVVLAYVATGFYAVQPNEQAVVRRCGKVLPEIRKPGLQFGFPWPIDRVRRLKVRQSKAVAVGMSLSDRALGRRVQPRQSEALTGDRNLILAGAIVHYRIENPVDYVLNTADVTALVRDTTASALSAVISSMGVDDVLTVQRVRIQNDVRRAAQALLEQYRAGVRVTSVALEGLAAPQEVADAFRDVTAARADLKRLVREAEGYASRLGPQTRGDAARIGLEAEAYADEAVQKARGDSQRFTEMAAELGPGRRLTVKRLILETMEEVLPRLKKIVIDDAGSQPLDLGLIEAGQ